MEQEELPTATVSKKELEKYKRHVKTSKHTDYGIGKTVLWNCGVCETEYPSSRDFQKHLCQQKKSRRPMDAGLQPARYTNKPITKKIYQEAKKWSLPVMYGVAFEEKWCLPGNNAKYKMQMFSNYILTYAFI